MAGCGIFVFQTDFLQIGLTCFEILSFSFFYFSLSLFRGKSIWLAAAANAAPARTLSVTRR